MKITHMLKFNIFYGKIFLKKLLEVNMRLILDRIEKNKNGEKIAVFEIGDEYVSIDEKSMPKNLINDLTPGIIIDADYDNGVIKNVTLLTELTIEKKKEMSSRLNKLFNRNKK